MKCSLFPSTLRKDSRTCRGSSKRSRRARMELLETRRVLAATAVFEVVDGVGILTVEGDKSDDVIEVCYDAGGISVTTVADGDITPEGLGPDDVDAIYVEGGKGNDDITIKLGSEEDGLTIGAGESLDVEVEGGKGDDTIEVNINNVTVEGADVDNELAGSLSVEADGGQGDDASDDAPGLSINVDGLTVNGEADLNISGGKGNDIAELCAEGIIVGAEGDLDMEVEGGPGKDNLTVKVAGDEDEDDPLAGGVSVEIEGGPGEDTIDTEVDDEVEVEIEGGPGCDTINGDDEE